MSTEHPSPDQKARPMLFSAPMVNAIMQGRKTQTRRALKMQPIDILPMKGDKAGREWIILEQREPPRGKVIRCRYGLPGDRIWVKETWAPVSDYDGVDPGSAALSARAFYRADHPTGVWSKRDPTKPAFRWRPSIHMPRWASRITLQITDVRAQRLQDISERDCCAEGCGSPITRDCKKPKFRDLWVSINGASSWDANPWVWAISFERIESAKAAA